MSGEASFCGADFRGASFEFADLVDSYCIGSDFREALFVHGTLSEVDFSRSNLRHAQFHSCTALDADFSGADLRGAEISFSNVSASSFTAAKLQGASLAGTQIVDCSFDGANLTGARVFGVTPWNVDLAGATQRDLVITPAGAARVTVDDLELAQFVHLMLDNRNLRRMIDTMTARAALVVGAFGTVRADRLAVLQQAIRARGCVPLTIDVTRQVGPDLVSQTTLLARLARFVVADFTAAPQIVQLLEAFVPEVAAPVLTLDSSAARKRVTYADGWKYAWYLGTTPYRDTKQLARLVNGKWLDAAGRRHAELQARRKPRG
ncbi:MAG TPA: pentapeptide repeat-containing protein [Vicinamibacterales bacterium]|nr:pentapeptide repeat-containing protein [Vicinamibacterales bacterium]